MALIGLVVIFSYSMGNVSAASGDSIYVNGTSGNNLYNGQSAVYDGTNGPKATIKNATGTVNSNGTIYIANGTYHESNIQIKTNMTIIGENQKNTIINGQQSGQSIFTITSGVYLNIINLTLTNGTSDNNGGAIYNDGNLKVYNSTFTGNTATWGGAISNNAALTINNSTFDNNTGNYGGVIWNSGDNSTITNNTFTNNKGTFGGVIYNEHTGTVIVTNNTFNNNNATNRGGAIYNYGTSTETSNTFNNNNATNGGAIYNQGTSTVINNTFNNNTATAGGAINSNGGTITINNCSFTSNIINNGGLGGAIYISSGTLTVNNSTFTNNAAQHHGSGGAIYNGGTLTVKNSTFTGNTASSGGGAIYNGGTLKIDNSTFTNNFAYDASSGGAIYNGGTLKIDNSTFTGNIATYGGGGAIYNSRTLTVYNSTFTGNTATGGGAIWNNGGTLIADSCTFTGNTASYSSGGAIYNDGTLTVDYSNITGNTATFGGAIYNSFGPVDARYNWWGSNNPNFSTLIYGEGVTYDPWIVLSANANPTTINIGGKSKITADLLHDSNGVYHDPVNGHVPDGITVNFSSDTKGTVNPISSTITNGSTNISFTGLQSGVSEVSAMVDEQTETTNVNINKISTAITVDPVTGTKSNTVNLTATLIDSDGNPVNGANVQFSVNGTIIGSAKTDTNGIATLKYTITQNGGYYYIEAIFAGDNIYNSSAGGATLKVLQSNIYVTVTSSNSHPKIGEIVKITFKVGNTGPDTANNVVLTLKIPEGMEYVSTTADTGLFTYNPTTRTITWNIGNVPVGDPKLILNIKVLKPGNYTIKPTITTTTYDPNITNNTGLININVSNNTTNPVQPVVNAETIPMQPTGAPIIPLILGALMTLAGLVKTRKN